MKLPVRPLPLPMKTERTIEIVLNTYGSSQELNIVKTDIPVVVAKKQIFGLITLQAKETVQFNAFSGTG